MKSILLLGAGMVGSAMARDLASKYNVTAVDLSRQALDKLKIREPRVQVLQADLSDLTVVAKLAEPFDLVLSAVPGFMGYKILETLIRTKKNVVDISFFPENALDLDALAKENGVTCLVDIGVAPGMDNIILGYYDTQMEIQSFECLVGGLPKVRKWPWVYKAPFSPMDVLEEYTRPARYVENGVLVTREALSDPEFVHFEKVGTLESFNTDGLRSIIFTMPHIRDRKEKTLRFPGHIEFVRVLRESGFLSQVPVQTKSGMIAPMELTSKLLFDQWKLGETEPEFTVMRVTLKGMQNGKPLTVVADLYDEYDEATQTSSMARTTGYTATGAINMFFEGHFSEKGVFPPELVGKKEVCYRFLLDYLAERGIKYTIKEM
jgi:lysine 6-dehydrogenase